MSDIVSIALCANLDHYEIAILIQKLYKLADLRKTFRALATERKLDCVFSIIKILSEEQKVHTFTDLIFAAFNEAVLAK